MLKCPKCRQKNDEDARYCIRCGNYLMNQVPCNNCGAIVRKKDTHCRSCGRDNPIFDPFEKSIAKKIHTFDRVTSSIMLPIAILFAVIATFIVGGLILLLWFAW